MHFGGHYKFVSKESVYPYAQRLFASVKPVSLSNAAMETLAIIAYKQPITRTEIEEIRGVGCDLMLKKLIARGLVAEAGRMDIPGRPILYQVTDTFMDSFQLESLEELPQLPKVQMNLDEDLFVEEREQPADEMAENEGM
ncbi:MAG: SMC-Scp complex subunit ScpB [Merdibacter sp.]